MGKVSRDRRRGPGLKASQPSTGGALSVFETIIDAGPPLHVHDREDECFYVLDGELSIRCGGEVFDAAQGSFVFLPRGRPLDETDEHSNPMGSRGIGEVGIVGAAAAIANAAYHATGMRVRDCRSRPTASCDPLNDCFQSSFRYDTNAVQLTDPGTFPMSAFAALW